jgi:hypothetical protein
LGISGGGGGGGGFYPPMSPPQIIQVQPAPVPTPPPAPAAPPPAPTPVDPTVQAARDAAKKKASAMAGYASTITTSGLGVTTPASTTAGKVLLGS